MFADETTLLFKGQDSFYLEAMANEDMLSAANWLEENKLSLNIKKTNFMHFDLSKKGRKSIKISVGKNPIKQVKSQKFLGVIFDDKLSWKPHIESITSKLNACLGATRRARSFLNQSSLFTIYYSLMQSHVQYCNSTWGAWEPRGNKTALQRLQAICNKFFRMIYHLDRTDSVRSLLKSKNVMNIFQNYDFDLGKMMQKAKENDLPRPLQQLFTQDSRNPNFFCSRNFRIKQTKKGIYNAGPRIWNSLPNSCITEKNSSKCKLLIKQHILQRNSN